MEHFMIIIFGLIILVAAVIAGVAAVLGNAGAAHAVAHPFSVLGYHLTGSTGTLFLYGVVVGAVGLLGLTLLLGGARRTSRRGRQARLGLRQSRRETATVSRDRDDLLDQREAARVDIAAATGDVSGNASPRPAPASSRSWQQRLLRPPPFAPSPEAASAPAATLPAQTAVITEMSAPDMHATAAAPAD
jgi:hypothetical protein